MASLFTLAFSVVFSQFLLLVSAEFEGNCPHFFGCGYLGSISFPFTVAQHPRCGAVAIHGCDDKDPYSPKTIQVNDTPSRQFYVANVDRYTVTLTDYDQLKRLKHKDCIIFNKTLNLPPVSPLVSYYIKYNITMFRCNPSLGVLNLPKIFHNYTKCAHCNIYYDGLPNYEKPLDFKLPTTLALCSPVTVAVRSLPANANDDPFDFLSADMVIEVQLSDDCHKCLYRQRGLCQLDSGGKFYCAQDKSRKKMPIVATVALVGAGVAVLIVLACCFRTKIFSYESLLFWKENPTHRVIEKFFKEHGPLPTARYSYSDVKKITNSFRYKLGQGGYGCVYKGKLCDGRAVAVKSLSKSKGDGEDFINEVASISRTSHVNIVRLLGFCLEGSERALIYEFMPNGSLEKFIYEEKKSFKSDNQLDCKTLFDIAIGVARGLEYLHRGCNSRILHFDIKPHNILLDENFSPKISDFGLAKICSRDESMVSIFGARGTAGYIAPEVFSRNFGAVSHKSDVYSYGMMVLEMVGRRQNINVEVDRSSEIYFPHWIYNRLESNMELALRNIRSENDDEIVRKMTIAGLWCIQTNPSTRPPISKVVEMLEGRVELLQIPPKPFLSSPSTSPVHLSCNTHHSL